MANSRGFWFALGAAIAAALGFVANILLRKPSPTNPSVYAAEAARAREEARIRGEIHSESDEELAQRFNRVAEKQDKKGEEG